MKRLFLLFFLWILLPLQAEKIIQCIANFPIDEKAYTKFLQERGFDGRVVVTDIKEYEEALLIRKKGIIYKLLRNLHLNSKVELPSHIEKIVFFNITPKVARKYDLSRLPKEKLVLFLWEPKTVLHRMYNPRILECFSKIYTWDDSLVDGKTYFKFHYPVWIPMLSSLPSYEERKFCTLVASDLKSHDKNELYSQRKEVIRFFEEIGEEGFEFYGKRWDPSLYKNYRGAPPHKLDTIKNYRFSICYENTKDTPGYITEKIFDCFAVGSIPVYWGASNIDTYIPSDCFIDRRHFASFPELYQFLKSMDKETYNGYLERIRTFLSSDAAQKFTQKQLAADFYQAVTTR